jgi:hypothetical protein
LSLGSSPFFNFDTLQNSFVTFGTFLADEEWHATMYMFMKLGRNEIIPFMIVTVIAGFIMTELFLASYINTYIQKVKVYNIIER